MPFGLIKAHRYIWLLLIIIIPLIVFFSIKDLTLFSSAKNNYVTLKMSKEDFLKSVENDIIKASLYPRHIEIILKSTLKNASSIVYSKDSKGNKNKVIGQLTSVGIYIFEIEEAPQGILIYDSLKDKLITKIDF